ncbi:hypothetical protein [Ruegeria sp.]|uniref:hypothetical protein n=1 Tax=Ruegeria sp. TaxID=1879320 RepID=UPI003C7D6D1D
MRKLWLSLILAALFGPLQALAQSHLGYDYRNLKKGTVFVYERSSGEEFELRFVGKRQNLYVFEAHSINGNNKIYDRTIYRNVKGQTVRMERSDGATIKYEPHNCFLVVGQCDHVVFDRNGNPGKYRANGKLTNRGYTQTTEYLNGSKFEPFMKVRMKFDKDGREVTRQIQQGGKKSQIDLKKVIIPN